MTTPALPAPSALLLAGLALAGCAAPVPRVDLTRIERTVVVGTDSAEIVLMDLAALSGHANDPFGWQYIESVTAADRDAGRFFAVNTGSDGGYAVRVTAGRLLPDEVTHAGPAVHHRIVAGNDGLLLDGGYAFPAEGEAPNARLAERLPVPAGAYVASLTSVRAWKGDGSGPTVPNATGGAALPDYVLQLRPVASVREGPRMDASVRLSAYEPLRESPMYRGIDVRERCDDAPDALMPVVVGDGPLPVPGTYADLLLEDALHERVTAAGFDRELDTRMVVIASPESRVGVLLDVQGSGPGPDLSDAPVGRVSGTATCAVRLVPGAPVTVSALDPLPLDAGDDSPATARALVDAYAAWLERTGSPERDYRLTLAGAASDARERFATIAAHADPPATVAADWLPLEAEARARALTAWLDAAAS